MVVGIPHDSSRNPHFLICQMVAVQQLTHIFRAPLRLHPRCRSDVQWEGAKSFRVTTSQDAQRRPRPRPWRSRDHWGGIGSLRDIVLRDDPPAMVCRDSWDRTYSRLEIACWEQFSCANLLWLWCFVELRAAPGSNWAHAQKVRACLAPSGARGKNTLITLSVSLNMKDLTGKNWDLTSKKLWLWLQAPINGCRPCDGNFKGT